MRISTPSLAKTLYAVFGTLYLLAGGAVLLARTGWLSSSVTRIIGNVSHGNGYAFHILQELSASLVFAGLITLWFLRHYEQSGFFHFAMTVFLGLFALIHWHDAAWSWDNSVASLSLTTAPFLLFALVGVLRVSTRS